MCPIYTGEGENMTVRQVEVDLSGVEDRVLDSLGYREFQVTIGETIIEPKPKITEKPLSSYSESQLRGFADSLGGNGNPISTFKLELSRLIDESIIRGFNYWTLTRSSYVATCLPLEMVVTDSRIKVLLGVIKVETNA